MVRPAGQSPRRPLIAYSDASYEPDSVPAPKLGWLIFDPEIGPKPIVASTLDVPLHVVAEWKPREQQIFPAEAFAPLTAILNAPALSHRDVIWFVDNEAACATLIRGASTQEDVQGIAEVTQLLFAVRRLRVWIEWIDSNPSDGLSRDGLACEWCRTHGVAPTLATPPPWASPQSLEEALIALLPRA